MELPLQAVHMAEEGWRLSLLQTPRGNMDEVTLPPFGS
jgi:hypothetical protein